MTDCIRHRGPDDEGVYVDEAAGVALGFRRLSIVDLSSTGHQPMCSRSGRFHLVFNGEVYNHRQLREELLREGASFRGSSDTEVLLAGIESWGLAFALKRVVGMFALALWDKSDQSLTLARDRIGEKPLFYAQLGSSFTFASELKALRRHPQWDGEIDRKSLASYLRHGYVPTPRSIYHGVLKVQPGTLAIVRRAACGFEVASEAYWSAYDEAVSALRSPISCSDSDAEDLLDGVLRKVVRREMVADVGLGALLSGGVDSSLVAALMQDQSGPAIKTFTIGFDDRRFNEAEYAKAVAAHLGTDHTELYVTPDDALALIPRLPATYDEPFADVSQIPTLLVNGLARNYVTVTLTGDAGDELFGGYQRYQDAAKLWGRLASTPLFARKLAGAGLAGLSYQGWDWADAVLERVGGPQIPHDRAQKVARLLSAQTAEEMYRVMVSTWIEPNDVLLNPSGEHPTALTEERCWPAGQTMLQRLTWLDTVGYLPDDILVKVDRASMAVSLESRAPFLDHTVIELAWRLPDHMKQRNGRGKWILRELLDRYVPRSLIERPKKGFSVPIGDWLRGPLREWAAEQLAPDRLAREGNFSGTAVGRIVAANARGIRAAGPKLWNILAFQAWLGSQS